MNDRLGEPLASGRDGAVYPHGAGRVLRRTFDGRRIADEARIISHVREFGIPVPEVHDVSDDGTEIVMERIDGPTMADHLMRHPWELRRQASILADLHHQLHALPAPDWLPSFGDGGDRIIHLDLHPENVLISAAEPVLIDWTNACSGKAGSDLATTWLILACAQLPNAGLIEKVAVSPFRRLLTRFFLANIDQRMAIDALDPVVDWRSHDKNMSAEEIDAMKKLATRHAR